MTTTLHPNQSRSYSLPAGSVINISTTGQALVENFGSGNALVSKDAISGSYEIGPFFSDKKIRISSLNADVIISDINNIDSSIKSSYYFDQCFVVGGQSNADGRGSLPSSDYSVSPNVILYTKNEEYEISSEPSGRRGNSWVNNIPGGGSTTSPGFSFITDFGKSVAHYTGVRPAIVPCAIGSTSMTKWLPPESDGDMTTLFGAMTARAKTVNGKLTANNRPIFLWYGHEADAASITETLSTGVLGTEYVGKWFDHCTNIRNIFPESPIVFAQLATHDDAGNATALRKAAESQRLSESDYGDSSSLLIRYDPSTALYDFSSWGSAGTNATNTANIESGKLHLVGDGSTALEGWINTLIPNKKYRLSVTATGTGTWKFMNDVTTVGSSSRSAGSAVIEFTAGEYLSTGKGRARFVRSSGGVAVDLIFEITLLEDAIYPQVDKTYMVVTHDLPRNANPDGYHVNTEGLRVLGRRFALAYAERVLGMTWLNGTGPRLVSVTKPSSTTVKVKFNKTIQENANGYGVNLAGSLFRVYDGGSEKTLSSCVRDPADDTAVLITVTVANAGVVVVTYGDRAGPADASWRQGVVYDSDNMPAPMFGPVIAA